MFAIKSVIGLFLTYFCVSDCIRRITNGTTVNTNKRYVVYLVQAPVPESKKYDAWLCGGAIVSSLFILTSAACVDDVGFLYAIAGYKKYVPDEKIDSDSCTKTKKKKIVYTCIPKKYELQYGKIEKWSYIDIALAKVESAYDFQDTSYESVCSYTPAPIIINYDFKYQRPNVDAMVFGWGHHEKWRTPEDTGNYNAEQLRYAPVVIVPKATCKSEYKKYVEMANVIEEYMICTSDSNPGNINEKGELLVESPRNVDGCSNGGTRMYLRLDDVVQEHKDDHEIGVTKYNQTYNNTNEAINNTRFNNINRTLRYGICQNDHGGPLVTWAGTHEIVIGVASVFRVTKDKKCAGPYLYTSTQCAGTFIDCVLSKYDKSKVYSLTCDSPPVEKGYDTVEKHISWRNHPDGPADNERRENINTNRHLPDI